MDFTLSEEQQAFQQSALDFAKTELAPFATLWDETHHFPIDTLKKAASLGFASLYIRDDVGGCNLSRLDAVLIFESLSSACVSTAAFLSIHNMASWMIDAFGDDAQRHRWLPSLVAMDTIASYCLTEPSAGSDAASLKATAVLQGDHYVLNGEKAFISGGGVSDLYVCMVRTGGSGPSGISCLVVERGTPGLSFGKPEAKMGWNSQPTTSVVFTDCKVPTANLLGQEGEGFKIAMKGLDGGRLNISACSLGAAQACFDKTTQYMKERQQFGKPLSAFQGLQFKLADMAVDLQAARLMLYHGASTLDSGAAGASMACAMTKRFVTDVGFNICNEALQLHGGYGYIKEYQIERFVRDVRVHQILEGTNEIMRLIIARHLLGATA